MNKILTCVLIFSLSSVAFGVPCQSVALSKQSFYSGATPSFWVVNVTPENADCEWTVESLDSWILLETNEENTFSIETSNNDGPFRTGHFVIAGSTYTVDQEGPGVALPPPPPPVVPPPTPLPGPVPSDNFFGGYISGVAKERATDINTIDALKGHCNNLGDPGEPWYPDTCLKTLDRVYDAINQQNFSSSTLTGF